MDTKKDKSFSIFVTALIVLLGIMVCSPVITNVTNWPALIFYLCALFVGYCALFTCIGYAVGKILEYKKWKKAIAMLFVLGSIVVTVLSFSYNRLLFVPIIILGGVVAGLVCSELKEIWYWYIFLIAGSCFSGIIVMTNEVLYVGYIQEAKLDSWATWLFAALFYFASLLANKARKVVMAKLVTALKVIIVAAMISFIVLSSTSIILVKIGGSPFDDEPRIYNEASDIEQVRGFLTQIYSGQDNAEVLGWDIDDPTTWDGVTFDGGDIVSIDLKGRGVGGKIEVIYFDKLTTLDVSDNPELYELDCSYNQIETLDVSGNTGLMTLNCGGNRLKAIDVSDNINLTSFSCRGNLLTSLDVSNNTELVALYCYDNMISELDLSANKSLNTIYCGGNPITSIDVSGHETLVVLNCDDSEDLTEIDIRDCTQLRYIFCWNTGVSAENILGVRSGMAILMDYKDGFIQCVEVKWTRKLLLTIACLAIISLIIDVISLIFIKRSEKNCKLNEHR